MAVTQPTSDEGSQLGRDEWTTRIMSANLWRAAARAPPEIGQEMRAAAAAADGARQSSRLAAAAAAIWGAGGAGESIKSASRAPRAFPFLRPPLTD